MFFFRAVFIIFGFFIIQSCSNEKTKESEGERITYEYYESGQIKEVTPYKGKVKEGVYKVFFEDGNLKSTGRYIKDKIVGDVKFYYPTGELLEVQVYDSTGKVSSYIRYDKEGEEIKKGAFPKLSMIEQKSEESEDSFFLLDLRHFVFDSVQVIVGPLDSTNSFVLDTLELIKCPNGLCKYRIQNSKLGSNIITGVVQDLRYEEGNIVEQNIVPFRFDNYIKAKDENDK